MKNDTSTESSAIKVAELINSMEALGKELYGMQDDLYTEADPKIKILKANVFVQRVIIFLNSEHVLISTNILFRNICCKYGLYEEVASTRSSVFQRFSARIIQGVRIILENSDFLEELVKVKTFSKLDKHQKEIILELICWADSFFREDGFFYPTIRLLKDHYEKTNEEVSNYYYSYYTKAFSYDDAHAAPTSPVPWEVVYVLEDPLL